jgi:hypothetical protein
VAGGAAYLQVVAAHVGCVEARSGTPVEDNNGRTLAISSLGQVGERARLVGRNDEQIDVLTQQLLHLPPLQLTVIVRVQHLKLDVGVEAKLLLHARQHGPAPGIASSAL